MIRRPPRSTLFPYTTLFRSQLPQPNDAAAGWAQNIQQDLAKVGAPNDLIQLVSATENHLKMAPREANGSVGDPIRVLREHLDRFCNARPQEKFFYTAAGVAHRLNVIGEKMGEAEKNIPSGDFNPHEDLSPASAMTEQCLRTRRC